MRFVLLFSLISFWSCQSEQNSITENISSDSLMSTSTTRIDELPDSTVIDINNQYQEEVTNINDSTGLPLGLKILQDFEQNGKTRQTKTNDSLFIEFLKSFTTYQNKSNNILFDDPNYETYNTLAYSPDNVVAPEAIKFRDSVKQLGFLIGMTEGMIFLEKDPEFLDQFLPYLSGRMKSFVKQYSEEIEHPFSEDASLLLSINEHVRRMMFWENFAKQHTDFELPEYANNQFEMYLFFLMFGMDNTPIYEWESKRIRTELIDTYNSVIKEYSDSKASEYLRDYMKYLEQKDFIYDRSFHEYGREKFPDMYGNDAD